jgi:hypothetical protein
MVFNTPNVKSLPGYLKMGWKMVGRPPVLVMPNGLWSLGRLAGARTAASLTAIEMRVGEHPDDVFCNTEAVSRLAHGALAARRWSTLRAPAYLRWRYGFAPLHYRVVMRSSSPEDGLAVFHLRRRGHAIEATVCDVLVPPGAAHVERELMRKIAALTNADYLLRIDRRRWLRGFVPVPRAGPIVTFRGIAGRKVPALADLSLTMGDVELF